MHIMAAYSTCPIKGEFSILLLNLEFSYSGSLLFQGKASSYVRLTLHSKPRVWRKAQLHSYSVAGWHTAVRWLTVIQHQGITAGMSWDHVISLIPLPLCLSHNLLAFTFFFYMISCFFLLFSYLNHSRARRRCYNKSMFFFFNHLSRTHWQERLRASFCLFLPRLPQPPLSWANL